jgi:hypothetical protein
MALVAVIAHIGTYRLWRTKCLTWGTVPPEAVGVLPGDDMLAEPDLVSTRATSIDAPAEAVWPWLVQMGPGRAGAYTYDWIENLFGLNMHSADAIIPEFQHVRVGDAWQLGRSGPVLRVVVWDPERALVLRSDDGNWVWAFILRRSGAGSRLISRNRITMPGASRFSRAAATYVMEPGSLVMERKMLLGIRQRAERLASCDDGAAGPRPESADRAVS